MITKPIPARINIIVAVLAIAAFAANAWAGEFYDWPAVLHQTTVIE